MAPVLPYHDTEVYEVSMLSDSSGSPESDENENENELEKEQARLLDSEDYQRDLENDDYRSIKKTLKECLSVIPSTISSIFAIPSRSQFKDSLCSWLLALLPSFLLYRQTTPRKLHPTSYLDGLRGFAALFVVFHHIKLTFPGRFKALDLGYHSTPQDPSLSAHFIQLPILRVLYNGQGMVAIFFVVSGYVLSYKPLKLIRKRDPATLLDSMASMIFRRHMRLYLPLIFTTFVPMVMGYLGAYPDPNISIPIFEKWTVQVLDWWTTFVWMANPFRPVLVSHNFVDWNNYDRNLWTIPVEFRGSMVVFLTLLGLAKVRPVLRMLIITGLVVSCFFHAIWDLFLFLSGSLIADVHFAMENETSSTRNQTCPPLVSRVPLKTSYSKKMKPILLNFFWLSSFLSALYIISFPIINPRDSPGYRTLSAWIPQLWAEEDFVRKHFWTGNGAVVLVFCVGSVKFLQYPFTNYFAQYLGRLSFSIYIVHYTWLHTAGERMMPHFLSLFGHNWGLAVWSVVFFGSLFWLSDLVMRGIDEKCVQFTRWMGKVCAARSERW